jgi:hypothetical protein
MPVIDINPNNSGTLKLGTTGDLADFGCQITNMVISPVANTSTRPGTYCAPPTQVPGKSSWTMEFAFLQDWTSTDGLSLFLLEHDGTAVDFEFLPDVAGAPTAKGKVYVTAASFGGAPAETWVSSGTWAIDGTPTFQVVTVAP